MKVRNPPNGRAAQAHVRSMSTYVPPLSVGCRPGTHLRSLTAITHAASPIATPAGRSGIDGLWFHTNAKPARYGQGVVYTCYRVWAISKEFSSQLKISQPCPPRQSWAYTYLMRSRWVRQSDSVSVAGHALSTSNSHTCHALKLAISVIRRAESTHHGQIARRTKSST
jgi:hypothetical protein